MNDIIRQLTNSKDILIASHIAPDGDAVGSMIAMSLCCRALNKKTSLYNESKIPAVYCFLSGSEEIVSALENRRYDTAVILDCSDFQRIGNWKAERRIHAAESEKTEFLHSGSEWILKHQISHVEIRVSKIINIDHHVTNTRFGDFHLIDTSACATAEIVYRLAKRLDIPVDKALGSAVYTGIFTDTGSFRFANTNKAAFEICKETVSAGVDPYTVAKHLYGTYSLGRIRLLNLALDSIEISHNGRLSMMTVTSGMLDETGTQPEDTDGLINYARRIKDVKVAVLIQECRNGEQGVRGERKRQFHVSLRSDGSVDVASLASRFGGGGHRTAAGFCIESSLPELKSELSNLANTEDPEPRTPNP